MRRTEWTRDGRTLQQRAEVPADHGGIHPRYRIAYTVAANQNLRPRSTGRNPAARSVPCECPV
ncbi:hypothetical protein SUDANB132_00440 [Streptomyces sp. enrichment culture]